MSEIKFYSVQKVAEIFGRTPATIRVWLNEGKRFPTAFKSGETKRAPWCIPSTDVERLAQKEYGSDD